MTNNVIAFPAATQANGFTGQQIDVSRVPTDWREVLLPTIQIAAAICDNDGRSLAEKLGGLPADAIAELSDQLEDVAAHFAAFKELAEVAQARVEAIRSEASA